VADDAGTGSCPDSRSKIDRRGGSVRQLPDSVVPRGQRSSVCRRQYRCRRAGCVLLRTDHGCHSRSRNIRPRYAVPPRSTVFGCGVSSERRRSCVRNGNSRRARLRRPIAAWRCGWPVGICHGQLRGFRGCGSGEGDVGCGVGNIQSRTFNILR